MDFFNSPQSAVGQSSGEAPVALSAVEIVFRGTLVGGWVGGGGRVKYSLKGNWASSLRVMASRTGSNPVQVAFLVGCLPSEEREMLARLAIDRHSNWDVPVAGSRSPQGPRCRC